MNSYEEAPKGAGSAQGVMTPELIDRLLDELWTSRRSPPRPVEFRLPA